MGDFLPTIDLGTNFEAVQISAGYDDTCAVSRLNTIKCYAKGYKKGYKKVMS